MTKVLFIMKRLANFEESLSSELFKASLVDKQSFIEFFFCPLMVYLNIPPTFIIESSKPRLNNFYLFHDSKELRNVF